MSQRAKLTVAEHYRAEGAMNALDVAGPRILALEHAAQALVDAMETCHECKGTVLVEEQPVHCEDCSYDCDSHEGAECPTIYSLHLALKQALAHRHSAQELRPLQQQDEAPLLIPEDLRGWYGSMIGERRGTDIRGKIVAEDVIPLIERIAKLEKVKP